MKDAFFVLLLFVLAPLAIHAQFGFGLSAGLNNATVEFNENFFSSDPVSRQGYFVGVAPYYKLSKQTRVVLNLQYSHKGYGRFALDDPASTSWRYSYLDLIPEVEYDFLSFLTLGVGANLGFKTEEAFREAREDWDRNPSFNTIKEMDWGLSGKAAIKLGRVSAFVRYNWGVMNVNNLRWTDVNGSPIEDASQRNRNVQIGLGYDLSKQ